MTYIDAFFATKNKGGLPTNALHDETLQSDTLLEHIKKSLGMGGGYNFYGAWANTYNLRKRVLALFLFGEVKQ